MNKINTTPRDDEFEFDFSLCHGNMVEEKNDSKEPKTIFQLPIKKCNPIKRKPTLAYMPSFYGR
jgi:hypothetical protein